MNLKIVSSGFVQIGESLNVADFGYLKNDLVTQSSKQEIFKQIERKDLLTLSIILSDSDFWIIIYG